LRLVPRTLFGRTLITLAVFSVGFQLLTLAVIAYLLLFPIGQRSAADLAAIMVHAADTWEARPVTERPAFQEEMSRNHRLVIHEARRELPIHQSWLPYLLFLEHALAERLEDPAVLRTSRDGEGTVWFWADIPRAGGVVRIGFPRSRIGVEPPFALFLVFSIWTLMTLATGILLARRLNAPLAALAGAARRIGRGQWPAPVREDGPEELASLARSFNRMSAQVRELVANRTTLLAGISHDLRTPLARMQLAVAMLEGRPDPDLVDALNRDLEEMNRLIGEFLEISRGLEEERSEVVDLRETLAALVADAERGGARVVWHPGGECLRRLPRLALCRVVCNLLNNAVRYGRGEPVELEYHCTPDRLTITIRDRGPGIPESEREAVFRPFHRLEGSRSSATGGSGLGLAIARQLAEMHGWHIALAPRTGGGTEAIITLPGVNASVRRRRVPGE